MATRKTLVLLLVAGISLSMGSVAWSSYVSEVLSDGPFAYYRFEEAAGPTAVDSSVVGANHPGTFLGGVTLGQSGGGPYLGNAADFNGSSGRVQIADHADFDLGTGNYTIEMWLNPDVTSRGDLFTYKGGGGDLGIHSNSQGADIVSLYHNAFRVTSPAAFATDNWYHLAITRSGTGTDQTTMYLNGLAIATGTSGESWNIANDLLIGANHTGSPASSAIHFNGQIDEVAIYNTALSADRVRAHFLAAVPEPAALLVWSLLACLGVGLGWRRRN